ncbi:MAG: FRG domain-containing protein [Negativicutes bacterium]|nr:FRG domain-containing protein [Negativicutes bacterium]
MERQIDCRSWEDLEDKVHTLGIENENPSKQVGFYSQLLFRGQASHEWALQTTLDRAKPSFKELADYYRIASLAKTRIETFTSHSWQDIDYMAIAKSFTSYDALGFKAFPNYDYFIYLRHHGFPSPLLDWSRSLYIAAFFAFQKPIVDRVAIFVYQEYAGTGKYGSSNEPQIHGLGPNVRSHPRHFLQQGEYTICVKFDDGVWCLAEHAEVFQLDHKGQDRLWKLTLPSSEAPRIMKKLDQYNINAFSLFQSEEALLQTLARELIQ